MVWILRILNVLVVALGFYAYFVDRGLLVPALSITGLVFFVSAIRKYRIVGPETLRGRFWIIFSLVGVFITLTIFWKPGSPLNVLMHFLSRVFLASTILMMAVGMIRRGLSLKGGKLILVFVAFALISTIMLYLALNSPLGAHVALAFAVMDIIVFTFTIHNLLAYLGSDLGRRWTEGIMAMLVYIVADAFFILGNMELAYFFLIIAISLMILNALIEE